MFWRFTFSAALFVLSLTGDAVAAAQETQPVPQADQQTYCAYLTEQAKAQSDFLRSPDALADFTQPETGLPTQLVAGAELSLANLKKAGITLDVARKNCELYKATTNVQMFLQYALPGIEKDSLTHRLALIGDASKSLQSLIDQTSKMVDAQNMTRPMLLGLVSNRIKLDSDRADTQSKIAALYVPPLSQEPLKQQVAAKQASDVGGQKALDHLTRQNNWDVALSVGAHQQVVPLADGVQPYGEVSVTYNLGSHVIDKHLDRTVDAYMSWKKVQENDAVRGMAVLHDQVLENIAAQTNRLAALQQESQEIAKNLQLVGDAETTAALDFRNQLTSTQLLLGIETGDATYRLDRLQDFLSRNF
jgi:hypothetical protein